MHVLVMRRSMVIQGEGGLGTWLIVQKRCEPTHVKGIEGCIESDAAA